MSSAHNVLRRAECVGIRLRLDGNKVKAILPDSNDPRVLDVVKQLRQHREEVRFLLNQLSAPIQQVDAEQPPTSPCYTCGGITFWRRSSGGYVCQTCYPNPWGLVLASWRIQ